jgi:hypothetical protein
MAVICWTLSGRFEDVETVCCLHPYVPEIALYPESSFGRGLALVHRILAHKGRANRNRVINCRHHITFNVAIT